jgi:hypothetical protein
MDGRTPPVEFIPGSGLRLTSGTLELSSATGRFVLSFTTRGPADSVQTSGEKGAFVVRGDTLSFTPDGREAQPPVVFRFAWKSDRSLSLTDNRGHVWDYRRR